jgi:hypothetical protein
MPTIVLKTKEGKLVYCLLMWLSLGITTKKISPEDAAVLIKNISDNPTVGYQILVKRLGDAGVISSFPVAIDDNPELSSINFSPRAGAGWIGVGNELGKSIDPNEWVNILEYIATSPGMVEVVDVDTLYNIDILQEACIPDSLLQKCLNGDAEASNKIAEIISAKTKEKIMQAQTAEEVEVEEVKKEETISAKGVLILIAGAYIIGGFVGAASNTKKVSEAYNRGVLDTVNSLIFNKK